VISRRLALIAAGTTLLAACEAARAPRILPEDGTIRLLDLLADKPEYSRFLKAIEISGLGQRLGGASGAVTLFVPTNEGFDALPAELRAVLDGRAEPDAAQRTQIIALVQANAAWGQLRLEDIRPRNGRVVTWDRARLQVTQLGPRNANLVREGQPVRPAGAPASILRADVLAADGVFHVTNTPVLPAI